MKTIVFFLFLALPLSSVAQNSEITEKLSSYYNSIDKNRLVDNAIYLFIENHKEFWEDFGYSIKSEVDRYATNWNEMRSDSSIILLTPILNDAEKYSFKKDIYDYLDIDTTRTQILYLNKEKGVISNIGDSDLWLDIELTKRELRKWQDALETIKKVKPDAWLAEGGTFITYGNNAWSNTNLLYLKDNKIYVVRIKNGRVYELNKFVRTFFKEKEFKEGAINDRMGIVWCGD